MPVRDDDVASAVDCVIGDNRGVLPPANFLNRVRRVLDDEHPDAGSTAIEDALNCNLYVTLREDRYGHGRENREPA